MVMCICGYTLHRWVCRCASVGGCVRVHVWMGVYAFVPVGVYGVCVYAHNNRCTLGGQ